MPFLVRASGAAFLLLALTVLAGCTTPLGTPAATTSTAPPACDLALAQDVYNATSEGGPRPDGPYSVRMTFSGVEGIEEGAWTMARDPARAAYAFKIDGLEAVVIGFEYFMGAGDADVRGRDHGPEGLPAMLQGILDDLWEDGWMDEQDLDPEADERLPFTQVDVRCVRLAGEPMFDMRFTDEGVQVRMVVEAGAPHRIRTIETIDGEEEVRIKIDHKTPEITLPNGTRMPAALETDQQRQETGSSTWTRLTFRSGTTWVPWGDLQVYLPSYAPPGQDGEAGEDVFEQVRPGRWQHDGWSYQLTDADGNGLVSAGDRLEVEVPTAQAFGFFDTWAQEHVAWP